MATYNEYEDKEALIENPSIPDINKVKADDMNYIKYNLPHISNEVDEDYRVNLINGLNIWNEEYKIGYAWNNQSGFPSRATGFIEVKPNTKYTIVVEDISNLSGGTLIITEKPYIDATTFPSQHEISSDGSTTFTTYASCYCLAVQLTISSGNISTSNFPKIMIVEGEGTYTYEPLIKRNINVEGEKFTDTLNVGSVVDSRSRVNVLHSSNLNTEEYQIGISWNLGSASQRATAFVPVKPSTTYYIRVSNISGLTGDTPIFVAQKTSANANTTTTDTLRILENGDYTITTISTTRVLAIQLMVASGTITTSDFARIMITKNDYQDYEPYITPSIYVDNEEIYSKPVVEHGEVIWNTTNVSGSSTAKKWYKIGNIVIASFEFTPLSGKIANGNVICTGLPAPQSNFYFSDSGRQFFVSTSGNVAWYYPTNTSDLTRIDMTFVYIVE